MTGNTVETIMISRKIGFLLVAMAASAMPAPALAQSGEGPIYNTIYLDENSQYTVGTHGGDCLWSGPVYHSWLDGVTSPNSYDVYVGYCRAGVWEHI
jgi:hypothetical protein